MSMKISSLNGRIPADSSDIDSAERLGRGESPINSIPSTFFPQNAFLPSPSSHATCCSLLEMAATILDFGCGDNAR